MHFCIPGHAFPLVFVYVMCCSGVKCVIIDDVRGGEECRKLFFDALGFLKIGVVCVFFFFFFFEELLILI